MSLFRQSEIRGQVPLVGPKSEMGLGLFRHPTSNIPHSSVVRHPTSHIRHSSVFGLFTACCLLAAAPAGAELQVTGIDPPVSHNYQPLEDARISGSGIIGGATVKLVRDGVEIVGTNVIFDDLPNSFRATFDLGKDSCYAALDWCADHPEEECPDPDCFAPVGHWDVVVTNPGGGETATLGGGFRVLEGLKIKPLGVFGGRINKTVVVGNLAYVGRGSYLVILDVSDPANIVELGSIDLLDAVYDLDVEGGYAFVCTPYGPLGFCIVDVSDPTRPELVVGGLRPSSGSNAWQTSAVLVHGNTAYVGWGATTPGEFGRLLAIDVTDPWSIDPNASGLFHGFVEGDYGSCIGAAVIAGDLLYAFGCGEPAQWVSGQLRIFDLSTDPLNPIERGHVVIERSDEKLAYVAVEGTLVYVAAENTPYPDPSRHHLVVIDASNPDLPFILARHEEFSGILGPGKDWAGLEVAGGIAHVTASHGFVLLDVTDPFSPPGVLSEFLTNGEPARATVAGSTWYLPDDAAGLNVRDITDPTDPVLVGNYASPALMRRMVKRGDLLYVTDRHLGVTVLDVSEPRRPVLVAQHQSGLGPNPPGFRSWQYGAHGIAERDGLLYVAAYYGGIEVLDVSDPANPVLAGGLEFAPDCYSIGLDLFGDLAIVGRKCADNLFSEIVVFDISDIQNIVEDQAFLMDCGGCLGRQPIAIETMPDGLVLRAMRWGVCYGGLYNEPFSSTIKHVGDKLYEAFGGELHVYPEDDLDQFGFCVGDATCWYTPVPDYASAMDVRGDRAYMAGLGLWTLDTSGFPGPFVTMGRYRRLNQLHLDAHAEGLYVYATAVCGNGCQDATVNTLTIYQAAIPGDLDDDDDVDGDDFNAFENCFGGPGVPPADADCLVFDFDEDGDVDCDDWAAFQIAWTAPFPPPPFKQCENTCPADFDGDGEVDPFDLATLLFWWGPCNPQDDCHAADADDDGNIGPFDLAFLLFSWGDCP